MELLIGIAIAVVFFVAGAVVGVNNVPSVNKAITALKAAEANAKATVDKIAAHKAS